MGQQNLGLDRVSNLALLQIWCSKSKFTLLSSHIN